MTREKGNSLPTGREERKALTTSREANQKLEEDIITSEGSGGWNSDIGIMDTAVITMVNLYLKNIPLSERCNILESVVSPSTKNESGIRAHIDGAKLAELIDKAKAYLAELLNLRSAASRRGQPAYGSQPEESLETVPDTVIGVDMSNTNCGMIGNSTDGAEYEYGAELKGRVVRVDDIDDDSPKYNPALEMSFDNLINKSWEVLYNLMKNLSGVEYVTHMPYEMAEMIANQYEKIRL